PFPVPSRSRRIRMFVSDVFRSTLAFRAIPSPVAIFSCPESVRMQCLLIKRVRGFEGEKVGIVIA
ncbi:MAG TPA: hypothetical protein PK311_09935, partial [Syntrophales bacterium]|nr:hypothetical protein [Syntrophales bacterium]